jgi:ribosome recycling factor
MSSEMADLALAECAERMEKAVTHAKAEFSTIRTGRATPALVERIPVDYYGTEVPLQQLAGFQVPEARQLLVVPFDKGSLGAIEKAIQNANLGFNPSNDGNAIRLSFPPLTQERRKEFVKVVKHMAEEGRVAIRQVRRHVRQELEKLEKGAELSKDELERAEKELDKLTHSHEAEIDKALAAKETELLED